MNNLPAYPKISLITPSLNQGQFIEDTIRSVLSQKYPNLEYIVIDGGSSDNTISILKQYDDQLTWVSEKDRGQADAINKGLRMANGDILAYLNADDLLLRGSLLRIAQKFIDHPDTGWVTGLCRIIDTNNREIRKPITMYKNFLLHIHNRSLLLIMDYISQPATFWRADMRKAQGLLDESLHYAMDYEYWLRLNAISPPAIIPEYLAAFRIHPQSKNTVAGHKDSYIDEEKNVVRRYTTSFFLLLLHDVHRKLMTTAYSIINKG